MASAKSTAPREVSVFGTDASGKPFFQTARVVSIDGFEVAVEGLGCTLDVNNIVGLRHGSQKGRFRVVWEGRKETPQQGQVRLRALEPVRDILGTDDYVAVDLPRPSVVGTERRHHPRITCHGDVRFRREGADATESGALKLLSETGCYIETVATAPHLSHLDLSVNVEGLELRTPGEVHGLQPGFGMGIAFGEMNPAHRARLHEWVFRHCKQ